MSITHETADKVFFAAIARSHSRAAALMSLAAGHLSSIPWAQAVKLCITTGIYDLDAPSGGKCVNSTTASHFASRIARTWYYAISALSEGF
jgi:hypothetical protein